MWLLTVIAMLAGGALAASNLIAARKPNARELIDKLLPYQGVIGVVLLISGLRDAVHLIEFMGLLSRTPGWMVISLLSVAVELALGFMLAYGLINRYILSGRPQALEKSERL